MLELVKDMVRPVARRLGLTRGRAEGQFFKYRGYKFPVPLVNLTGGGIDTWDTIARGHMEQYRKYCPIAPDANVLEIGCGVGRDAVLLTEHLSERGRYTGIDIIEPSIRWCQENITPRHSNFRFIHYNIESQIHNAAGNLKTTDIRLPCADDSVDRIILQSVFTHMFEPDIIHYLREFRRILKPTGLAFTSIFLVDDSTLERARSQKKDLTFKFPYGDGCLVQTLEYPEGAVAFTEAAIMRMVKEGGMQLDQPIHRGFWSGLTGVTDGQDIMITKKLHS